MNYPNVILGDRDKHDESYLPEIQQKTRKNGK
jgi:hypothetical protein